ncbi:MAG: metallophosphoesterase [Planctomycetes bacterium]|nr:metallophosphoesterase [Planctomycetota bacterium]
MTSTMPIMTPAPEARVFISADYHFLPGESSKILTKLSDVTRPGDCVLFLGDLFEVWYENYCGSCAEGYEELFAYLKALSGKGVAVHLLVGNRDFLAGPVLHKKSAMEIHSESFVIKMGDESILCLHGDELLPDDVSYQRYKNKVRHPMVKRMLRLLPNALQARLAGDARARSKQKLSGISENTFKPRLSEVSELMLRLKVSRAIAGHLHHECILEDDKNNTSCFVLPQSGAQVINYRIFSSEGLSDLDKLSL